MNRFVLVLICAALGIAATNPPTPVVGVPGGDPWRKAPLILWGNYLWPDSPAAPPVFKAGDFLNPNSNFVDRHSVQTNKVAGSYEFAPRDGARQVMWFPDTLKPTSLSVNGFPWQLTPAANQPVQSLQIHQYPGHVYFTSEQNSGGQSSATHDPVIVQ